jgi:alpha-amylase/alpha-mannosidase (GH57 family)
MSNKINLVICWHMHQPHYKDGLDGEYHLPWVYLHAIKDYTDMAAFIEQNPNSKAVVNYTPVLLEQIIEYAAQMRNWLNTGQPMCDPLLNLVSGVTPIPSSFEQKKEIVIACRKAHAPTMIETFPAFNALFKMAEAHFPENNHPDNQLDYLSNQFYTDLLVWYHIAWIGASIRQNDNRVNELIDKSHNFSESDQRKLIEIYADHIESIIPRYKSLQDNGQIEISMTPYGHPIIPLLLDFNSMRDALPDAPAPKYNKYPGGYDRSNWHMEHGFDIFEQQFEQKPTGIWLSEGAVSDDALDLLDDYDIKWTATGEGVWRNTCHASDINEEDVNSKKVLYQPTKIADKNCKVFFRDDGLSDLIGFQYKDWKPEDAVNNFIHHIENIANQMGEQSENHVVPVILDGENAWEYYPDNASEFLNLFYKKLSEHPDINMTTFSEAMKSDLKELTLPSLQAGSWVYGSFSTWIGDKDKNIGWDLLIEAKRAYDQIVSIGKLTSDQLQQATEQLAICEGSDWFWWFGDYNPSGSVKDFDELYRRHLRKLYTLLNVEPPEKLDHPISQGGVDAENSGTMRRNV